MKVVYHQIFRIRYFLYLIILIVVFKTEENHYGLIKDYLSHHNDSIYLPVYRERLPNKSELLIFQYLKIIIIFSELPIIVIVVVDKVANLKNYALAQDSIECYCRHFNYPLVRIFPDKETGWNKKCPMKDVRVLFYYIYL